MSLKSKSLAFASKILVLYHLGRMLWLILNAIAFSFSLWCYSITTIFGELIWNLSYSKPHNKLLNCSNWCILCAIRVKKIVDHSSIDIIMYIWWRSIVTIYNINSILFCTSLLCKSWNFSKGNETKKKILFIQSNQDKTRKKTDWIKRN